MSTMRKIDENTWVKIADVGGGSGGGTSADIVELTKAEYDALPDSKLTDGKQYFIKDYSESGGSGNSNIVIPVTCASANGWSEYSVLPSGYSAEDYIPIAITSSDKRVGQNMYSGGSAVNRIFAELSELGVRIYNQDSTLYNRLMYVTLQKMNIIV